MSTDIRHMALHRALSQINYQEKRNNWTIFASDLIALGIKCPQNAPYCAIGNAWSYIPWINLANAFGLPWYVPGIWADAKRNGWNVKHPVDGDIVIYDWQGNRTDGDHTGLAYPSKGPRYAIEFNTSPGKSGSQGNGDGVYLRQRDSADIIGYISVAAICKTKGWTLSSGKSAPLPTMRQGARGDYVERVQRAVGVPVDGVWGPATDRAVIAYQRRAGLTPDGVVGAATWGHFVKVTIPRPVSATRPKVRKGDHNGYVKEIQRAVGAKADGKFGPETLTKVKAYQRSKGLTADGVVGRDTWSKILGKSVHVA